MVDVGTNLMTAGVDLIAVDSYYINYCQQFILRKIQMNLNNWKILNKSVRSQRDFSNAWKMLNYANNKVKPISSLFLFLSLGIILVLCILVSSQVVVRLLSFIRQQLSNSSRTESDNQAIKGKIPVGDKLIEEKIGRKVGWEVRFQKRLLLRQASMISTLGMMLVLIALVIWWTLLNSWVLWNALVFGIFFLMAQSFDKFVARVKT